MKKIKIDLDDYDKAAQLWVKDVFKKYYYDQEIYDKFERAIDIKYVETKDGHQYVFDVLNEKKFLISVLKYSINFDNL